LTLKIHICLWSGVSDGQAAQIPLFNNADSSSDSWIVNWKGCGRKRQWPNVDYCPSTCLKDLRRTH
jgi:hypothetical protein